MGRLEGERVAIASDGYSEINVHSRTAIAWIAPRLASGPTATNQKKRPSESIMGERQDGVLRGPATKQQSAAALSASLPCRCGGPQVVDGRSANPTPK